MGTDHSQWTCMAYFPSPGPQKERFGCAIAGIKGLELSRPLGHSEVSMAPTSPTWVLPTPPLQVLCFSSAVPLPAHGPLIQTTTTQLISLLDLSSALAPCTMGWVLPCQLCDPRPSGGSWPTRSMIGKVKWPLLLAWTTGSCTAGGHSWWRDFLLEMTCK